MNNAKELSFGEIFLRLKWIEKNFGPEILIFFLAEMILAHQTYNFADILSDLNQLIKSPTAAALPPQGE